MNVGCITGYIVSEMELKTTSNGVNVCGFTVAVKRPNVKEHTDYIDCVAWRERAEFLCKYFQKGSKIEIAGHFETRLATMKDNSKRKYTELYCENIGFGERKTDGDSKGEKNPPKEASYAEQTESVQFDEVNPNDDNRDLPF